MTKIRVEISEEEFIAWNDEQCACKHDVGIDEIPPINYFPNVTCDDQIRLRSTVWDWLKQKSEEQQGEAEIAKLNAQIFDKGET